MKQKMVMWLTAFVLLAGSLPAQETKNDARTERKRPDFAAMQLKQVLDALMLDDATAAKFTPVYQAYQKEMRKCRLPRLKKKSN